MKKLISLFLCLCLAAGVAATEAESADAGRPGAKWIDSGIYGFIKVGSDGQLFDLLIKGAKELGAKVSGLDAFAMINRTWLTIAGGVAALAGGVMAFKKA